METPGSVAVTPLFRESRRQELGFVRISNPNMSLDNRIDPNAYVVRGSQRRLERRGEIHHMEDS